MDRIPIGEAAKRIGVRASTLRYYEERGLVGPVARIRGARVYGPEELRRLAFIHLVQRLGLPLDTAAAVLDEPDERWRAIVGERIGELDRLIEQARGAREFLLHALACPAEHPARECPYLTETLDRLLEGATIEQIAGEYRDPTH